MSWKGPGRLRYFLADDPPNDVLRQAGLFPDALRFLIAHCTPRDPLGYKSTLVEAEQLLSTGLRMCANWRRCRRTNSGTAGALPPTLTLTNFLIIIYCECLNL